MKVPRASELDAATQSFERDWAGVDSVLYDLCKEHKGHANRAHVVAKLVLIDRAYAAGLERCVSPPKGTQAITVVADFVSAHGDDIDEIMAPLSTIAEPLTVADMEAIVLAHARLLRLLSGIPTNGRTPRSFASKYLHFHHPVVPIYDDYACRGLTRVVRWDSKEVPLSVSAEQDDEYFEFCVRFWRLYDACLKDGLAVTVKILDHFLWQIPLGSPSDAASALDPRRSVSANAWPGSLVDLDRPGLYAWWVDDQGADQLSRGLGQSLAAGLIYIGQAGAVSLKAGIASSSTLRSRIGGDHLRGRVRNSTLRRTLASILLDPLGLVPVAPLRLTAESEDRLSVWMADHLSVATWSSDSAAELTQLEQEVVVQLCPQLNLDHAPPGELRTHLRELRRILSLNPPLKGGGIHQRNDIE